MGINRTLSRIQTKYFWPRMKESVTEFIKKCLICAKRKAHKRNIAPLQPIPAATFAWQRVAMDFVGPLEESYAGNRYILTMTEFTSRYVEVAPLKDRLEDGFDNVVRAPCNFLYRLASTEAIGAEDQKGRCCRRTG